MDYIGLYWAGSDCTGVHRIAFDCMGFGLGCAALDRIALEWVGLHRVGLGSTGLHRIAFDRIVFGVDWVALD